jgi:hypothetical protein
VRKINFEVDRIQSIEEANDSQFARLKLYAFASGGNSHNLMVSEEALKRAAHTIYDKPVVWFYDKWTDDAKGHEPGELPCGFVPKENNPLTFEHSDDGRLFLVMEALVWKRYSGDILRLFERDNETKPVSVELNVLESKEIDANSEELVDFVFMAITVLGTNVRPAVKDAKAVVVEFSEAKAAYMMNFEANKDEHGTGERIPMDLSKKALSQDSWGDVDKTTLRNNLLKASNYKSLVNACYLIVEDGWENAPSQKLSYPVCQIKSGKLVYNAGAIKSARGYLEANKDESYYKKASAKLSKIEKKLELGDYRKEEGGQMKDFVAKFGMTANEMFEAMCEACGKIVFDNDGYEMSKFSLIDYDDAYMYAYNYEDGGKIAIPFVFVDGKPEADFESVKPVKLKSQWVVKAEEDDATEEGGFDFAKEMAKRLGKFTSDANTQATAQNAKNEDVADADKELIDKKGEGMDAAKVMADKADPNDADDAGEDDEPDADDAKKMSDNVEMEEMKAKFEEATKKLEELEKFKAEVEMAREQAEVEATMADVADVMPDEKMEEVKSKVSEFSTIESWKNFAYAEALPYYKEKSGKEKTHTKIGFAHVPDQKTTANMWEKFKG